MAGPLGDGVEGTLALYTYEDETTDSEGNTQTNYYRYTVGLAEIPECAAHVPELYCQRKFAFELVDGTLCCYVHGHKKKAAELDAIRAASVAVATRLHEESAE